MFSLKGPSMIKATYPTAFPLKHQQKVTTLNCCFPMYSAAKNSFICIWTDLILSSWHWANNSAGSETCIGPGRICLPVHSHSCSCKRTVQGGQIPRTCRWGFLCRHRSPESENAGLEAVVFVCWVVIEGLRKHFVLEIKIDVETWESGDHYNCFIDCAINIFVGKGMPVSKQDLTYLIQK